MWSEILTLDVQNCLGETNTFIFSDTEMAEIVEIVSCGRQGSLYLHMVNIMTADDQATQGARALAAMILTLFIWYNTALTPEHPGSQFNIKMIPYQNRKSHCGDKMILRPSYLHNGISYTVEAASLYWIGA